MKTFKAEFEKRDIAEYLDANVKKKFYIASPFFESTGEYFSYYFQPKKTCAYLVIENEAKDTNVHDLARSAQRMQIGDQLKFFITFKHESSELGISELQLPGRELLLHYSPQIYIPVMELLIDIVGDGVSINYLVRPKGEDGYNVFRMEFIKTENESRHIRGDFQQTLIRWG